MVMKRVEVVSYDSNWEDMFKSESERISEALGQNLVAIHHIGSTSVPGLAAKPVIDLMPVVRNILNVDEVEGNLMAMGYVARGELGMMFRRYFYKGNPARTHNVHIFEEGDPEIERHLLFRNWMRSHEEDKLKYGELKSKLAEEYPNDIKSYCFGKDQFIASIDAIAGFSGRRIVTVFSPTELHEFKLITGLDGLSEDPELHHHFVLYQGNSIVGAAYVTFEEGGKAAVRKLIAATSSLEDYFNRQVIKWLGHKKRALTTEVV